jgi:hypothetical protein
LHFIAKNVKNGGPGCLQNPLGTEKSPPALRAGMKMGMETTLIFSAGASRRHETAFIFSAGASRRHEYGHAKKAFIFSAGASRRHKTNTQWAPLLQFWHHEVADPSAKLKPKIACVSGTMRKFSVSLLVPGVEHLVVVDLF